MQLRVGELAKRAGLTVRTLHHYDSIGLLSPSARSASGFRLYSEEDVIRLHRIQALKQLGCALTDIAAVLNDGKISPLDIVDQQISALAEQARHAQVLQDILRHLREQLRRGHKTDIADWLTVLERMTMYAKHFTHEELIALHEHSGQADATWAQLLSDVKQALANEVSPATPLAQQMSQDWVRFLADITGNNVVLTVKLVALNRNDRQFQLLNGVTPAMLDWISQSCAHAKVAAMAPYLTSSEQDQVLERQLAHINEWPPLIADVRIAMNAGVRPEEAAAQSLADRWLALFRLSYCGDDMVLGAKIRLALQGEAGKIGFVGLDAQLLQFMHQAIAVRNGCFVLSGEEEPIAPPKPTALAVASLRAAHQFLDRPLIFEDVLAHRILGVDGDPHVHFAAEHYNDAVARVLRASLAVRSRLAEDEWTRARAAGVNQYVILGAGLDTYAYRQPQPASVRVFEVDLPATQHWKRHCLRRAAIIEPDHLIYAPIDFTHATLRQGLISAGFDIHAPAFFTWLGVAVYLDEADVLATLRFIASCAKGSEVVFDYAVPPASLSPREHLGWELITTRTANSGEPWKSYFDPAALSVILQQSGFSEVENYSREQLHTRYLAGREDGLRLGNLSRLIRATV